MILKRSLLLWQSFHQLSGLLYFYKSYGFSLRLILFFLLALKLNALSYEWVGSTTGDQNWTTTTNWDLGGSFPTSGDNALISKSSAAASSFNVVMGGAQSIHDLLITFSNTGAQTFGLSGGSLAVDNGGSIGANTGAASSAQMTFTTNFPLTGSMSFDNGANTTFIISGTLTGSGGLTKEGEGRLTLTSANTYTGATTITDNGSILLTGDGTLGNGSNLNLTLFGSLVIDDDVGVKTIGNLTSTSADSTIVIGNNSTLQTNYANPSSEVIYNFDGVISGQGGVNFFGQSTSGNISALELSASSTYQGATEISQLNLRLLTGAELNSTSSITLAENGNLILNGSSNISSVNLIEFTGNNSSLSIIEDTVIGSVDSTLGLSNVQINLNDSELTITQIENGVFQGYIYSPSLGAVVKQGADFLTLQLGPGVTHNSFSDQFTINAGVLSIYEDAVLGNIGSTYARLTVEGSGVLRTKATFTIPQERSVTLDGSPLIIVDAGTELTIASEISGSGNLVKFGMGTLILTGDSTSYTGDTLIQQGTLIVNGTFGGSNGLVSISSNATLRGTGQIFQVSNTGGTLSPGTTSSIGTLSIFNTFNTNNINSIFEVNINRNGQADKLEVGSTATLGGYVRAITQPGAYRQGMQVPILTATSITNSFVGIIEDHPQSFALQQIGNTIYIVVTSPFIYPSAFVSQLTGNAKLTYDYLSCASSTDDNLINLQNDLLSLPSLPALTAALLQLCPALFSALPLVELQNNIHMAQIINQKNRKFFCDQTCQRQTISLWIEPLGIYYNQKGVQQQFGFHNYTYGVAAGCFVPYNQKFFSNMGAGYTQSKLNWNNNYGHAEASTIYIARSFGYFDKRLFTSLIVQGDIDFYKAKRNIEFTGVSEQATHWHKSYNFLCGFDLGLKWELSDFYGTKHICSPFKEPDPNQINCHCSSSALLDSYKERWDYAFFIQPQMQLYYLNLFQNGFTEEGGGDLNLSVRHKYSAFLQADFGIKWIQEINIKQYSLAPNIYIGYLANIPLTNPKLISSMNDLDIPCYSDFYVNGYHRTVNQLSAGAQFVLRTCRGFLMTIDYNITALSHMTTQSVTFKFNWDF